MDKWIQICLIVIIMIMTVYLQVIAAKMKSSKMGLIIPLTLLTVTLLLLRKNFLDIKMGNYSDGAVRASMFDALLHFALYNIPTIIFLCIYNYYKRRRLSKIQVNKKDNKNIN